MIRSFATALALSLGVAQAALASDPIQTNNTNTIWFENWTGLSGALMRIQDPDGRIVDVRAATGTPVYQLKADGIVNGTYRYELRATSEEMVKNRDFSNSQDPEEEWQEYVPKAFYRTGSFVVQDGVIMRPEDLPKEEEKD